MSKGVTEAPHVAGASLAGGGCGRAQGMGGEGRRGGGHGGMQVAEREGRERCGSCSGGGFAAGVGVGAVAAAVAAAGASLLLGLPWHGVRTGMSRGPGVQPLPSKGVTDGDVC